MVARFGDRTRVTSQVKTWGKDVDAAVGLPEENVETFTAPGTWNWPGKADYVTVTIVGGGGGSGARVAPSPAPATGTFAGGGGGVNINTIAVSGPVPVVVGAGGLGGSSAPGQPGDAANGGDSSFGSFVVGGGGGGRRHWPTAFPGIPAPAIGGGGGAFQPANPSNFNGKGGAYGYDSTGLREAGGAGSGLLDGYNFRRSGKDFAGFGSAGLAVDNHNPGLANPVGTVIPNTGNGAPAIASPVTADGLDGSSGVVVVRWWE